VRENYTQQPPTHVGSASMLSKFGCFECDATSLG